MSEREPAWGGCIMNRLIAAALLVAAAGLPRTARAASYFVSTAGDDSAAGTTAATAWQSLDKVSNFAFSAGDTIDFERGDTWSGQLSISGSGTSAQPITYSAYGSGSAPVITNSGAWSNSIYITASWIIIDGFLLRGSNQAGVYVATPGSHDVVRNCEMTAVGSGVLLTGSHNLVSRNRIHDTTMIVNTPGGNDDYGANGVIDSGVDNEIAYNTIYNCIAASYDYGTDGGAVELYGTVDGAVIHGNNAYENNGFMEVGGTPGDTAHNVTVAYNVSRNNLRGHFMMLHNSGQFGVSIANLRVDNNTLVETEYATGWIFYMNAAPQAGALSFKNNIVDLTASGQFSSYAFTRTNNLYAVWPTSFAGGEQPNEIAQDPLFVDAQANDFHLQAASPAIDAGASLGYVEDCDGNPVPYGPAPDMGAYEWRGPSGSSSLPSPPTNLRIVN